MKGEKVLKTEVYSLKYLILVSFIGSLLLAFLFVSFYFIDDKKIEINSEVIRSFIILFIICFGLIMLLFLSQRKSYHFYVENGKLIFKYKNKKTLEFDFKSIELINIGTNKFNGLRLIQRKPKILKISFFVNKDFDFINWLKSEVELYKESNPNEDVKITCYSYKYNFAMLIIMNVLIYTNFINNVYLSKIFDSSICLLISLVCMISLIILIIYMFKTLRQKNITII